MAGSSFPSQNTAEAWMKSYAPDYSFIYFVDAYDLLTVGTGVKVQTNPQVLQFEAASSKAGNESTVEALILSIFKLELSSFFGADSKATVISKYSRDLPDVKTFDV